MLNLNASLTKMDRAYSSIWSEDFTDAFADDALDRWLRTGGIEHDTSHVRDLDRTALDPAAAELGGRLAGELASRMAIMGVFDEGCMGMYNAIIPDEFLNPTGVFKERLSQSALFAEMRLVDDAEARAGYRWLLDRGMQFRFGTDGATELTEDQVLDQLRLYIAAVRIADEFGCDAIGIQYQQGLKDLPPASDLAEGMLNNGDRPPVVRREDRRELYPGRPLPHFNEVDECSAVDALITNRVWTALGLDRPRRCTTSAGARRTATTTSGCSRSRVRCRRRTSSAATRARSANASRRCTSASAAARSRGSAGPARSSGAASSSWTAPSMDLGRGTVADLPSSETERRWQATTPQWPIMHAVLHGVTRDQMMARHKANHIQVAYGDDATSADRALATKAAMFDAMGIAVHLCGEVKTG